MPDIRINAAVSNTSLPIVSTTKEQIKSLSGYKAWLRAQDGYMNLVEVGGSKYIERFNDYGGGTGSFISPEVSPKYAKRVEGSIGGYEAAYFLDADDPSDTYDRYNGTGFTFDWAKSWTVFGVAQADAAMNSNTGALMGIGSTGSDTKVFIGTTGTGNLSLGVGSSGASNIPLPSAAFEFIASFYLDPTTPANSKFTLEVNGVRSSDIVRAPLAANTGLPVIGSFGNVQGWKGVIREMGFLQQPVHYGVADQSVRNLLRKHARMIYGLS